MTSRPMQALISIVLAALVLAPDSGAENIQLKGAGGTFPAAIYGRWFDDYHNLHPEVKITYQPIGSGGGIRKVIDGTVDFGATDGPMTDAQLSEAKGKILHFPTVLGAVVPIMNVEGLSKSLAFTGEALAGIFLGKITRWNDPEIVKANPGVALPPKDIVVVHRADGSGTTFIWTDYLSKVSSEWQAKAGRGTAVEWPVGLAARGSDGIAKLVQQTSGAISYVELTYALENMLDFGAVKNSAGTFVHATVPAVTAAGSDVKDMPDDFRVSITNAAGKDAYPIASFTWLLVPANIREDGKRKAIVDMLRWMIGDGQRLAEPLSYAPLPKAVVDKEAEAIAQLDSPAVDSQ
jgi:phosphate transport system substrate-binding protein